MTKYISARLPQPYTKEAAAWWVSTGSKIGIVKAITNNDVLVDSISAILGDFERQKYAEIGYWLLVIGLQNLLGVEALLRKHWLSFLKLYFQIQKQLDYIHLFLKEMQRLQGF